jgi:hypothetical protein
MATLGGNLLPPRHVDLYLRMSTDGKDRCVSRQARQAGLEALSAGLSYLCPQQDFWVVRSYIDNGGCSLERRWFVRSCGLVTVVRRTCL